MHRCHIGAANQGAAGVFKQRVCAHQQNRPKADNKGQEIEVTHKSGGPEHAFTRLARISHGKEAHQNVWQSRCAKHQPQPQRQGGDRIFHQPAGLHNRRAFGMNRHRLSKQRVEAETGGFHYHNRHEAGTKQQQHRFNDLHPGSREHAAEQHIEHHQNANQYHGDMIIKAEQQLDKLAGSHHLRNQIERNHHQRTAGGKGTDRFLLQPVGGHIGKGIASEIAQPLSDQKQDHRPADQKAERIDQPVIARGIDQRRNTKK